MKLFWAIFLVISLPFAAQANCAQEIESTALDVRALQSSMMVAALSCDQQDQYNRFVSTHKDSLHDGGEMVVAYFKRIHGSSYKYELNRFVTQLANKATKASMQGNDDEYCDQADEIFAELTSMHDDALEMFVSNYDFSSLHGVNICS